MTGVLGGYGFPLANEVDEGFPEDELTADSECEGGPGGGIGGD